MNKEVAGIFLRAAASTKEPGTDVEQNFRKRQVELVQEAQKEMAKKGFTSDVGFRDDNMTMREAIREILTETIDILDRLHAPEDDSLETRVSRGVLAGLDMRVIPNEQSAIAALTEHVFGLVLLAIATRSKKAEKEYVGGSPLSLVKLLQNSKESANEVVHKHFPNLLCHAVWAGVVPEEEPTMDWDPTAILLTPYCHRDSESVEFLEDFHRSEQPEGAEERIRLLHTKQKEVDDAKKLLGSQPDIKALIERLKKKLDEGAI